MPFEPKIMSLVDELRKSEIFKELTDHQLDQYASVMTVQTLARGETLFEQGSASDAFYVLLSGHLIAILVNEKGTQQRIGNIGPGEVVGEMGVLTNQPRALKIVAQRESRLGKITQADFQKLYALSPKILLPITHLLIRRMQSTFASLAEKRVCDTVYLLATEPRLADEFCQVMNRDLEAHQNQILMLTEREISEIHSDNMAQALTTWEEQYRLILIVLPVIEEMKILKLIPDHATRMMVLTPGDQKEPTPPFIIDLLENSEMANVINIEIIYCYPTRTPLPDQAHSTFLENEIFTRRHHLIYDEAGSRQRLLRFLTGKAIGLVIGGGGTRIWAAVGAVQYLLEQGIEFDAVGGTSSGSIVAACLAHHYSGFDFMTMIQDILSIDPKPISIRNFTYPILSLLNGVVGTQGLKRVFKHHRLEDFLIELFVISCSLTSSSEVKHRVGLVWEALRASVALPGIYPPFNNAHDHHELLVDGGVINNLPTDRMRETFENRGRIIAIDLSNVSSSPMQAPKLPSTLNFFEAFRYMWQGRHTPGQPNIFDILFNSLMIASEIKSKENRHLADVLISPALQNNNILAVINKKELMMSGRVAAAQMMSEIKNLLSS
jgi:predicted acylesterase/phospholipase RssA/CRP-like cAMP-binding protein